MKARILYLPILLIAICSIVVSCNSGSTGTHEEEDHHAEADTVLALNNGMKWRSDTMTSNNVMAIKMISDQFAVNLSPTVSNYQELATNLGEGLNKMIKECKMSGPDHDALHVWLEPIIKQNQHLKSIPDTIEARKVFITLKERIDAYPQFFEDDIP